MEQQDNSLEPSEDSARPTQSQSEDGGTGGGGKTDE